MERHELMGSEFAVLEALYHKGDLPIGELGDRVLLTSGSMTYVIDKLARRGLLTRRRCAQDQRVRYAAISAAGRRLMASIFPDHAEAIRRGRSGSPRPSSSAWGWRPSTPCNDSRARPEGAGTNITISRFL